MLSTPPDQEERRGLMAIALPKRQESTLLEVLIRRREEKD